MTVPERAGVAIIGGGPAGSALAALLARAGLKPVLLEKDFFPRPKLCGEFLSTESQELLRRAGCLDDVLSASPARIDSARLFSPSGRRAEFPLGGEALSLSRRALDEILFRRARAMGALAFEGVEVRRLTPGRDGVELEYERRGPHGTRERGRLRADRAVAASGRRSALDRRAGRVSADVVARAGFKRRHVLAPGSEDLAAELRGHVEVHLFDGGYCGLSFVEDGSVNVCALVDARRLAPVSSRWEHLAKAFGRRSPSLRARLERLVPEGETLSVAQLRFDARGTSEGPVLFVGDAAGMIAPLCGDGQAMALESAVELAGLMAHAEGANLPRLWDKLWRERFSSRLRIGRLLNELLIRPQAAEMAALAAGFWPGLGRALVSATRGRSPETT